MSNQSNCDANSRRLRLCEAKDVPAGEAHRVELGDGHVLAVYNVGNAFYATDDLCSHGAASLSEGMLEDFQILCPFHLGAFDIRTGEATAAPCHIPIHAYRVSVVDGVLYAELGQHPAVTSP